MISAIVLCWISQIKTGEYSSDAKKPPNELLTLRYRGVVAQSWSRYPIFVLSLRRKWNFIIDEGEGALGSW